MLWKLARKSLLFRKKMSILIVLCLSLSISLLLAVERLRLGTQEAFSGAISQTNLIVGARGGSQSLLLYSVFRIGDPTHNIRWETYEHWKKHPAVAWTIPLSLGDSHRGFPVVATNNRFYEHFRFRGDRRVEFLKGEPAQQMFDLVIGSRVHDRLRYELGDEIFLSHGHSGDGPNVYVHDEFPFRVVGILRPTQTPLDSSVFIDLQGMEAIHWNWFEGAPAEADSAKPLPAEKKLPIREITSFLLGTGEPVDAIYLRREIDSYDQEALMAISPGIELSRFWSNFAFAEKALQLVSALVALSGLIALFLVISLSIQVRSKEFTILRSIGVSRKRLVGLLMIESLFLSMAAVVLGTLFAYASFFLFKPILENRIGVVLSLSAPQSFEILFFLALVVLSAALAGLASLGLYRNHKSL